MNLRWKSYLLLSTTIGALVTGLGLATLSSFQESLEYDQVHSSAEIPLIDDTQAPAAKTYRIIPQVFVGLLLSGSVSGLILFFLLEKALFSRLQQLQQALEKIERTGHFKHHLPHWGNDEISQLAYTTNTILGALDQQQVKQIDASDRYLSILDTHTDLVFRYLADGTLTFVNRAFCQYFDQQAQNLLGTNVLCLLPTADQAYSCRQYTALNLAQPTTTYDHQVITTSGKLRWIRRTDRIETQCDRTVFLSIAHDITEQKQVEVELKRQAFYDSLTELPNRALFVQQLERAIAQFKVDASAFFAVVFLDLDRFKTINDTLGRLIGDQVLITIAQRLAQILHTQDCIARLGGDEFAILLNNLRNGKEAIEISELIVETLQRPLSLGGHTIFSTASLGIATINDQYDHPDELLRDADIALSQAKALGQSRYQLFNVDMRIKVAQQLKLETDLRQALKRHEFCLHFQPIILLSSGQLSGFEVLVRWNHPQRGLIFPGDFIPVAEETGLIIPLDWWVLQEACLQAKYWINKLNLGDTLTFNVNISSKQFVQPDLVSRIQRILQRTGLKATLLKLEITESAVMEDIKTAAKRLNQLKDLGVKLSIDDFGTGYSSLNYLHSFPLDNLKIDRSFVSRLESSHESLQIVQAIIGLAHNLGFTVVAEGIETASQLRQLNSLGCEYGQGYLFSKPLDTTDATQLIQTQRVGELLQPL